MWATDTTDPENQRRGITLLSNAPWGGSDEYVKLYRLYLEENTDPLVKAISIRALGRFGDASDAVMIAEQLDSEYIQVRLEAAKALQRLHNTEVVDAIWIHMVNPDENEDVRVELAIALAQYPRDDVFQALATALDDRMLALNLAALDSMRILTGRDFGLDRALWLSWYDSTESPFLDESMFLYPTFKRTVAWYERLMFWDPVVFESPGAPKGMDEKGLKKTYDDGDKAYENIGDGQ